MCFNAESRLRILARSDLSVTKISVLHSVRGTYNAYFFAYRDIEPKLDLLIPPYHGAQAGHELGVVAGDQAVIPVPAPIVISGREKFCLEN